MKGIVDRFEGPFVVIEIDGACKDIPRDQVDRAVKTGDVVKYENGKWITDKDATQLTEEGIKRLADEVWED